MNCKIQMNQKLDNLQKMIDVKNEKYLFEKFNVKVAAHSKEELNNILDEIIKYLNDSIKFKLNSIKKLKNELDNINSTNNH